MLINKLSKKPKFTVFLLLIIIFLPIFVFLICLNVPYLNFLQHITYNNKPNIGFSLFALSLVISVSLFILFLEIQSVLKWERKAEEIIKQSSLIKDNNEPLLKSWFSTFVLMIAGLMGLFAVLHPTSPYIIIERICGVIFLIGFVAGFISRSRWSPWGIPLVEIYRNRIKLGNLEYLYIDGIRKNTYFFSAEGRQFFGVYSIPLEKITSIKWNAQGKNGMSQLIITTSNFTVDHPLTKKSPLTIDEKECIIIALISAGSVTPDAIVNFAEYLIKNQK